MKFRLHPISVVVLFSTASLCAPTPWLVNLANAQSDEVAASEKEAQQDEKESNEATQADDLDVTDTATPPTEEIGMKFVRFHMWDGTVVSGEIQVDYITVKTQFGALEIPIHEINRFRPGLDSFPKLNQRIMGLVEKLGDKDFDVREKSHRALAAMGIQLRYEIEKFDDGGSAERKKRLAEIKKEIDELVQESIEESNDDGTQNNQGLIRGDKIETSDFTIVGKILQDEFSLSTKFGQLKLRLSDIRMGDRSFQNARDEIHKTVTIAGDTFFQRKPLSTRIRVNQGDVIKIRASGAVRWTNWNTTSTPDGLTNQGQYLGIMSGTLTARIGSTGKLVKIGSKGEFVAKKSGVLFLAIAVQDNYANNNNSYRWTGDYKAKIRITPASK